MRIRVAAKARDCVAIVSFVVDNPRSTAVALGFFVRINTRARSREIRAGRIIISTRVFVLFRAASFDVATQITSISTSAIVERFMNTRRREIIPLDNTFVSYIYIRF